MASVFAGNPLLLAKQEGKSTSEILNQVKKDGQEEAAAAPLGLVLPVLQGRPLVTLQRNGITEDEYEFSWRLSWRTLSSLGISTASDEEMAESASNVENLVYMGETRGLPHFAMDVVPDITPRVDGDEVTAPPGTSGRRRGLDEKVVWEMSRRFSSSSEKGKEISFIDIRNLMFAADWRSAEQMRDLAIAGQARTILEWHKQTKFCGVCGSKTEPYEAGSRRMCTSSACKTKVYPRTDPVVIMLVIDRENERAVLSRQARFPPLMWSCLAGFIESGETLEEAVKRETREEIGLEVGEVKYHCSQPWPVGFGAPASQLMIGLFATATTYDIKRDESELEDARWLSKVEVKAALQFEAYEQQQKVMAQKLWTDCQLQLESSSSSSSRGGPAVEPSAAAATTKAAAAPPSRSVEGFKFSSLYVPGPYAIAHSLIKAWAYDEEEQQPIKMSRI